MRAQELRDTNSSFLRQPADRLKQHPCRRKDVSQQWWFAWPRQHVPRTHHLIAYAASITAPPSSSRPRKATSRWKRADVGQHFMAQALPSLPISVPVLLPAREAEAKQEQLMPLPRDVENLADDPQLQNPLQRLERMSTGWFGVVLEYEGVVVEDTSDLHTKAWLQVAQEERRPAPLQFLLKRAEGMKNDQVVKEVFCWTREPMEVRRLAERKEAVLTELLGNRQPLMVPGMPTFMEGLQNSKVPAALATSSPEARIKPALRLLGLENAFARVVTAEDVYRGRPDPEPYLLAAQHLGRPPARCVVIGNSNQTVEAARECGMASVVVAGRKPFYELKAADLVVKHLDEICVVNLKQLFRNEDLVSRNDEEMQHPEAQEEEDSYEGTENWL